MKKKCARWFLAVFAVLIFAGSSQAQVIDPGGAVIDPAHLSEGPAPGINERGWAPPPGNPEDPDWGPTNYVCHTIGPADFVRRWSCAFNGIPNTANLQVIIPAVGETGICVGAPVHLPTGALIQYIRVYYFDTHTSSNPAIGLHASEGFSGSSQIALLAPDAYSGGDRLQDFGPVGYRVVNNNTDHFILALLDRDGSGFEGIYKITTCYSLHVSPAPAVATFPDVDPSFWAFQYIEALAASDITQGFPDGTFRPLEPVTRAQMATFLARALGLHWPQ